MTQLDLENINLTKKMLNDFNRLLEEDKILLNSYKITNFYDFNIENKVNFYFILFKYILKNPIYSFQIPLLSETRKNIIKIINNESYLNSFSSVKNNLKKNKAKIKYMVDMITDSNYYFQKFIDYIDKIIYSNLTSNKNSFFGSDYKNSNPKEILNLLDNLEEDWPNNITDIDYDTDFEFNCEIIEEIMKQSEITFNVGPFNRSTNISNDDALMEKFFFLAWLSPIRQV